MSDLSMPTVTAPADPGHAILVTMDPVASYTFSAVGDGDHFSLTNNTWGGLTMTGSVTDTTYIRFLDETVIVGNTDTGNIARLYTAALGRAPDQGGLDYWLGVYSHMPSQVKAQGVYASLAQVSAGFNGNLSLAGGFTQSAEFQRNYGSMSDTQFVTQMYANVLHRAPDAPGLANWVHELSSGWTREMVLVGFAESTENISNTSNWMWQV